MDTVLFVAIQLLAGLGWILAFGLYVYCKTLEKYLENYEEMFGKDDVEECEACSKGNCEKH